MIFSLDSRRSLIWNWRLLNGRFLFALSWCWWSDDISFFEFATMFFWLVAHALYKLWWGYTIIFIFICSSIFWWYLRETWFFRDARYIKFGTMLYVRVFYEQYLLLTWLLCVSTVKNLYWVWYNSFWYVYCIARSILSVGRYFSSIFWTESFSILVTGWWRLITEWDVTGTESKLSVPETGLQWLQIKFSVQAICVRWLNGWLLITE